ncbi:2-C-methyl-D-erythritol 4-phosphate cytidylyltransferase [Catenovulum sp. 2E275]|uniref:2-C-methyl-D-erythritol 4-phosphate cytidylyltransferase n=1 Tax=Catenovulum sp. 2E275 TaxID=2980497 RepID=UPI0021D1B365|nr:2-C-methyl-D-erythritol 4-phosphate cytidylyltransferase [Catenovulum sp. 2E275]MCU4676907.1 2-C-methyl-D-erythritol 4-phosphate cytidylyltransferase [Catenovulum sp. 2E275]
MTEQQIASIQIAAIIPAAGVGKRMQANIPKQYLTINQISILEHTIRKLSQITNITQIVVVVSESDPFIKQLQTQLPAQVKLVTGGAERVYSVLAGLRSLDSERFQWCLVHDAARPCVLAEDIEKLIQSCLSCNVGGILATQVRDTMKRQLVNPHHNVAVIEKTENRDGLWHALTPQMFKTHELIAAIELGLAENKAITDEASAMELTNAEIRLIEGDASNIKITRASDLALAEYFLNRE